MARIDVSSDYLRLGNGYLGDLDPKNNITNVIFKRLKFVISNVSKASLNSNNIQLNSGDVSNVIIGNFDLAEDYSLSTEPGMCFVNRKVIVFYTTDDYLQFFKETSSMTNLSRLGT